MASNENRIIFIHRRVASLVDTAVQGIENGEHFISMDSGQLYYKHPTTGKVILAGEVPTYVSSKTGFEAANNTYNLSFANVNLTYLVPNVSKVRFVAPERNSGAIKVNIAGTTYTVTELDGATQVAAGRIAKGTLVEIIYDGTNWRLANQGGSDVGGNTLAWNAKTLNVGTINVAENSSVPTPAANDNSRKIANTEFVQRVAEAGNRKLNEKADLNSPTFTGAPKAPTPTVGSNDGSIATTAFVNAKVNAAAETKADIASPTFTGAPKAPTPASSSNDTTIATTAYVTAKDNAINVEVGKKAPIQSPAFAGKPTAPHPEANSNNNQIATTQFVNNTVGAYATAANGKAEKTTTVSGGNGLTGGGSLASNQTISLGTPSSIGADSTNSVTQTSHTHAIDKASTTTAGIVALSDSLTDDSTVKALTAKQGKILDGKKANLNSPNFTGKPTVPAPQSDSDDTQIATTQFVNATVRSEVAKVALKANGLSETLNEEIASKASKSDLTLKANINSPTFSGSVKAPTPASNSNDTTVATTEFVKSGLNSKAEKTTTVTAGNGLTGGGNLTENRTISLGTPSTITGTSTNSATAQSHTHAIDKASTTVTGITRLYDNLNSDSNELALTAKQGKRLHTEKVPYTGGTMTGALGLRTSNIADAPPNTDYLHSGFYRWNTLKDPSNPNASRIGAFGILIAHPSAQEAGTKAWMRSLTFEYGHRDNFEIRTGRWDENGKYQDSVAVLTELNGVLSSGDTSIDGVKTFKAKPRFEAGLDFASNKTHADAGRWGYLGANDIDTHLHNRTANSYLQLRNNGTLYYNNKKVYHEGAKPSYADLENKPTTAEAFGLTDVFIKKEITNENLNNVFTPSFKLGMYNQELDAKATAANNYPVQESGTLILTGGGWRGVQVYIPYVSKAIYKRTTLEGSTDTKAVWSKWVQIGGTVNNLNSDSEDIPLSAKQGKILDAKKLDVSGPVAQGSYRVVKTGWTGLQVFNDSLNGNNWRFEFPPTNTTEPHQGRFNFIYTHAAKGTEPQKTIVVRAPRDLKFGDDVYLTSENYVRDNYLPKTNLGDIKLESSRLTFTMPGQWRRMAFENNNGSKWMLEFNPGNVNDKSIEANSGLFGFVLTPHTGATGEAAKDTYATFREVKRGTREYVAYESWVAKNTSTNAGRLRNDDLNDFAWEDQRSLHYFYPPSAPAEAIAKGVPEAGVGGYNGGDGIVDTCIHKDVGVQRIYGGGNGNNFVRYADGASTATNSEGKKRPNWGPWLRDITSNEVVDNVVSDDIDKPLSARQGKQLNDLIVRTSNASVSKNGLEEELQHKIRRSETTFDFAHPKDMTRKAKVTRVLTVFPDGRFTQMVHYHGVQPVFFEAERVDHDRAVTRSISIPLERVVVGGRISACSAFLTRSITGDYSDVREGYTHQHPAYGEALEWTWTVVLPTRGETVNRIEVAFRRIFGDAHEPVDLVFFIEGYTVS